MDFQRPESRTARGQHPLDRVRRETQRDVRVAKILCVLLALGLGVMFGAVGTIRSAPVDSADLPDHLEIVAAAAAAPILPDELAGGMTTAVAFDGTTAFVSSGPRIIALDVSDPGNTRKIGRSEWFGPSVLSIDALATHEGVLYVSVAGSGLLVMDTAEPGSMTIVDRTTTQRFSSLLVSGDLLLAGEMGLADRVLIFDLADPAAPLEVGQIIVRGEILGIHVHDGRAYIAATSTPGLYVYDLGDPTRPAQLGVVEIVGSRLAGRFPPKLVGNGSLGLAYLTNQILILDLGSSAPLLPDTLSEVLLEIEDDLTITSVQTDGRTLVVSVAIDAPRGHILGMKIPSLLIFDITDRAAPVRLATFEHPARDRDAWIDLHLIGDTVFAGSEDGGLLSFDIAEPSDPRLISHFDPIGDVGDIVVDGDLGYLADGASGLRIVDLSGQWPPPTVGLVDTPANAFRLTVANGYAFVADLAGPLSVIDVSNPSTPRVVATLDVFIPFSMSVDWPMLYIAVSDTLTAHLQVYDVSDPSAPRAVGSVPLDDELRSYSIASRDGFVYFDDSTGGIVIVDARDPSAPRVMERITSGSVRALHVQDERLLVATSGLDDSLHRIAAEFLDISDPTRPLKLPPLRATGEIESWCCSRAIAISGELAYFVGYRVEAADLSAPTGIVPAGGADLAVPAIRAAASERFLFTVSGNASRIAKGSLHRYSLPLPLDPKEPAAPSVTATTPPSPTPTLTPTRTPRPTRTPKPPTPTVPLTPSYLPLVWH